MEPPVCGEDPRLPAQVEMLTCVKVEDVGGLALHRHRHVVPLNVGGTDAPVRQLNLEKPPAALHAVQRHVVEARLDVRFVGVEGVVEDVLHDLQGGKQEIRRSTLKVACKL